MKTPSNETVRHVVINLVPYHINPIRRILPEENFYQNDNRDRHNRRPDYRNDRESRRGGYNRNDRYGRDENRYDRHGRDDNSRDGYRRDDNNRDRFGRDDNVRDHYDRHRNDRHRFGRGGNRGHGGHNHGGKRQYHKKPDITYIPNFHILDNDIAEIFKTDIETEKELDFRNIYQLYYWMYYSFRQMVKEKMSKLSDDLKDEDILIQLVETNQSIFQIIIKTGAGDDMNAILAQESVYFEVGFFS